MEIFKCIYSNIYTEVVDNGVDTDMDDEKYLDINRKVLWEYHENIYGKKIKYKLTHPRH